MKKKDIERMISVYSYYIDKLMYPWGNGKFCLDVEEIEKMCSFLLNNASLVSSFRTNIVKKQFKTEINHYIFGTFAIGIYVFDKEIEDDKRLEDLLNEASSILLFPVLKSVYKLVDISHSGNRIILLPENKEAVKTEMRRFFSSEYYSMLKYSVNKMVEFPEIYDNSVG